MKTSIKSPVSAQEILDNYSNSKYAGHSSDVPRTPFEFFRQQGPAYLVGVIVAAGVLARLGELYGHPHRPFRASFDTLLCMFFLGSIVLFLLNVLYRSSFARSCDCTFFEISYILSSRGLRKDCLDEVWYQEIVKQLVSGAQEIDNEKRAQARAQRPRRHERGSLRR